jgi:CHAD domain-containing protein
MKRAFTDKWLPAVPPDVTIHTAAVRTLRDRLGAVEYYLPLAAEQAEDDVEYVHQLRVWTRRATAALRLYQEVIPRRRLRWLKKQLRRIRRAANDARDSDVLIQRLKQKAPGRGTRRWLKAALADRAEAQGVIVAVYDRLRRDDQFTRRIGKLVERVTSRGGEQGRQAPRFGGWARERLRSAVERFFSAVPSDPKDAAALHQFRIRGKQLRYLIELLAAAFPDGLRTEVYPVIEAIQDRLGDINDLATAQTKLREKIERANKPAEASDWRRLLAAEQAEFEEADRRFWGWCTPSVLKELRGRFEALLNVQRRGTGSPNGPLSKVVTDPAQRPRSRYAAGVLLMPRRRPSNRL